MGILTDLLKRPMIHDIRHRDNGRGGAAGFVPALRPYPLTPTTPLGPEIKGIPQKPWKPYNKEDNSLKVRETR